MIQEMEGGVRPTIAWLSWVIGIASLAWVLWNLRNKDR